MKKAQSINIKIFEKEVSPEAVCRICKGEQYHMGYGTERIKKYDGSDIVTDKEICYDLGEHFTGYLSFDIKPYILLKNILTDKINYDSLNSVMKTVTLDSLGETMQKRSADGEKLNKKVRWHAHQHPCPSILRGGDFLFSKYF